METPTSKKNRRRKINELNAELWSYDKFEKSNEEFVEISDEEFEAMGNDEDKVKYLQKRNAVN